MGDKNNVAQTEDSLDLLVKSGHGILKAIYTTQTGDRNWIIRDGLTVCPAVGTVTFCNPVANTFSCAAVTVANVLEERTACGTIVVCCAIEERTATGTVTSACSQGEVDACIDITMVTPTIENTACGTITLASVAVGRTLNVNGRVYTAVCGTKCDHTEFDMSNSDCIDAIDLLDSLNNDTRCIPACDCACGTTNTLCGAVITVTSVLLAASTNCITLTSSDNCDIAISACGFTGGKCCDTVTIDTLVYTATAGAHGCDFTLFDVCGGCNTTIATDLAASICMDARCPCVADNLSASSCCAVVTVVACPGGVGGNAIAVSDTAEGRITSPATFCCGVDGDTVTLNGLIYTAVEGARAMCDFTEFSNDTGNCATAIDLELAINCDTRCGVLQDLTATSCAAIVTLIPTCSGTAANAITLATSCAGNLTISCCTLTGGTDADTVTINGLLYTSVCGAGSTACMQFSTDTSNAATATDLALRINCDAVAGTLNDVTATACCVTVTVVSDTSGAGSNAITMATNCAAALAVSCCTLTGGNDACTITVNGLTYTAVSCAKMCDTEFSTDVSNCATATDLADSIDDDVRAGTTGDLTSTAAAAVVTIVTDVCGVAGNAITISSSCGTTIGVGCGFEGGVDADTVTINGLVYTASAACCACMGEWDNSCMSSTNFATVVQADGRAPVTVPTHDIATAANMCCVVTLTADPGEVGSCIDLTSSSAARLLTSGATLTGGVGREVIEIDLVGATSGEISIPYFNHPMRDGIFIDYIAGTTGRLSIIYE